MGSRRYCAGVFSLEDIIEVESSNQGGHAAKVFMGSYKRDSRALGKRPGGGGSSGLKESVRYRVDCVLFSVGIEWELEGLVTGKNRCNRLGL